MSEAGLPWWQRSGARLTLKLGYLVTREVNPGPNRRQRKRALRLRGRIVERDGVELGWVDLGGES